MGSTKTTETKDSEQLVDSDAFLEHPGLIGENFGMLWECDSCHTEALHTYGIVAGTVLGELMRLEESAQPVETADGTKYVDEQAELCEKCLHDLIEAKRLA